MDIRYFLHILFDKKLNLNLNLPPQVKLSNCSVSHYLDFFARLEKRGGIHRLLSTSALTVYQYCWSYGASLPNRLARSGLTGRIEERGGHSPARDSATASATAAASALVLSKRFVSFALSRVPVNATSLLSSTCQGRASGLVGQQ